MPAHPNSSLRFTLIHTLLTLPLLFFFQVGFGQSSIFFHQLSTTHGLSDNYINDMCVDKGGNLWIGTGEGINMYNGKTITRFFYEEYPQLQNNHIRQLLCDDQNRIWVLTQYGNVTLIDEDRRFHRVSLYTKGEFDKTRWLLQTQDHGVILYMKKGLFSLSGRKNILTEDSLTYDFFSPIHIPGIDSLLTKTNLQMQQYDSDSYIFNIEDGFFKVNFKEKNVGEKYQFPGLQILTKWGPDDLLVMNKLNSKLQSINLSTRKITFPFNGLKDQFGDPLTAKVTNAKKINDKQLLLTTNLEGLYIIDLNSQKLYNYKHVAADPSTITNNKPLVIASDNNGWVFLGVSPNGISYFKSNAVIGQRSIFLDKLGNSFDGYINTITTVDNDTYYIGSAGNLLEWKRSTNTTNLILYSIENGKPAKYNDPVSYLSFDSLNRLWVAIQDRGIYVLDKNKKLVRHISKETLSSEITHMKLQPDGFMWIATINGIFRVNTRSFETDNFKHTPLQALNKVDCWQTYFPDPDNIWIASAYKGLWHYQRSTQKLTNYTTKEGLLSNQVICVIKDSFNNIYAGSSQGLNIFLSNGRMKTLTDKNGLLGKGARALLLDKKNRLWIGNNMALFCFTIKDSSLKFFDERYGFSVQGFRLGSYHQNSDDELVFGTEKGLQYFYPDELVQQTISFPTFINRIESRSIAANLTQSKTLKLSPLDNYVTFHFGSVDFSRHLHTFYEYKLENLDNEWVPALDQDFVRYSSLAPGKYIFKVRASNDKKIWKESENQVAIIIAAPFYKTWGFKTIGILLALFFLWIVIKYYKAKQQKQREALETEAVINYFASQINKHLNIDDMLWDIAKNCISKLNFEDCVIYLVDEDKKVLVQKAAYGPKMEKDFAIYNPIEIPIGKGVVGTVAQTGKPELVNNTEIDKRYIADDARRLSELAVPLIIDNKVAGVLDSENSQKNFFKQKHLNILNTVGVLCAAQIQRVKAEGEKQKAKIEILENKQKVAESRLQSLRLQMNPHFLFNALNSIQQMILANEEMVATKYLSKFSKLLRTILVHSDKEYVTLKEELEILKLYIDLESIRFKDSFKYSIECAEEIDTDEIKLPTLLIQPFVENAIWHGLMHKEGERFLQVRFSEPGDCIQCVIEDNGVGREKSTEAKLTTGQGKKHTSKGIQVSLERLEAMGNGNSCKGSLQIFDLKDKSGNATGTRVEIVFPIKNN